MFTLNKFKRKTFVTPSAQAESAFFFQIRLDEIGAYLATVDQKGKPVCPEYRYHHGFVRDLLYAMEQIREKQSFHIDWETPQDQVYLADHHFLMESLRHCEQVINAQGQTIDFMEDETSLLVLVDSVDEKQLRASLRLAASQGESSQLSLLTPHHVLAGNCVYSIPPLNDHFADLPLFETTFLKIDLEKYLSLFYSHFEKITVRYEDFQVAESPPKHTKTALIFEKIDHEQSLYLRISNTIEGLDEDFFEHYEINRLAVVNEMERTLQVSPIIQESAYECYKEIQSLLGKHKKQLKGQPDSDFFVEDTVVIIEKNLAQSFIHQELPRLVTQYALFGSEKLQSYQIRTVTPQLRLSLGQGIDFLEGEAHLDIEGESFSLFEALNLYRKHSYIPLNDGTHALINQRYLEKLERVFKKQKKQVKVSFFDLPAIEELIDEKAAQASFPKSREIFRGFNDLQKKKTSLPTVQAELRPYQKQGYHWLNYLRSHSLGGCLADDMGLGKTLQAITLLSGIYPKESLPSLIVMPKSLIFNWQRELERFQPDLSFYVFYGNDRDFTQFPKHHLVLTTYGMLRNQIEQFQEVPFCYIILDESQNIKNLQTQTSKSAMLLNGQHRLALSGTPLENNLGELYSLFRFLNPAMFGSVEDFNRHYLVPIQQNNDKEVIHELRKKIYPFLLRRLKKDVLKELPDKVEKVIYVEMSPEQKQLYHQRRQFYQQNLKQQIAMNGIQKSQFFIFQALNELRQIAAIPETQSDQRIISPKREVLIEQILESVANRHKVLVFGNFLSVIEYVGEDLAQAGIEYLTMTGATRDRGALVERFQNDPATQVFLMTLKTGGLGLNLTRADTIFIFDPWWNLAAENQAIDRAHRIGQDKTVFSYKLITRESIEEKMVQLQEKKRDLFENIISSDSASIKSLDESDIDFIFN